VTFRAADRIDDRELGISYFIARISFDDGELERLGEDVALIPGMPAEVFIATGARTVIDYLTRPLTDQFRRTMNES
jgi:HlyD family secretion protein